MFLDRSTETDLYLQKIVPLDLIFGGNILSFQDKNSVPKKYSTVFAVYLLYWVISL